MEGREVAPARSPAAAALRAILLVLPAVALTVHAATVPVARIVGRVPDDALFYLVIARRLLAGEGFTFDGVAPTTGFHPAWLALVTATAPVGDPTAGFRGLILLHGAAVVASVLLLDGVLLRAGVGRGRAGVSAAAAGAWAATAYGLGMETALVSALALTTIRLGLRLERGGEGGHLGAAVLGFALGITRVDAAPLLLGAGRRAPTALLGGAAGVAATLAFNRAVAGEWVSTAAGIKGLGSVVDRVGRLDPGAMWRHLPAPAVGAIVVIALALVVGRARVPRPMLLAGAGAAAWIAASYLFNNLVGPWYLLPPTWILVAAAVVATASCSRRVGAALTGVLVVTLLRTVALPAPGLHATVVDFARAVNAATPPDARVLAEDFPGIVAWFGERTVLPGDGLATEPGYRTALTTGAAFAWWEARGATHYAVTRRRAAWSEERPLVDRIAPPFLPVPPSPVPLDAERRRVERVDPGSGRLFALYPLDGQGDPEAAAPGRYGGGAPVP